METKVQAEQAALSAVAERYHTDAIFHALVHLLSDGGYADEDGVAHHEPTLADAQRVQRFYDALDSIGYEVRRKPA